MSGFFQGCKGVDISGGKFNAVKGNLEVHHWHKHSSNEEMPVPDILSSSRSAVPGYRGDHTGPPSPHPRFSPSQTPSTATNLDSFNINVERPHTNGVFNDNFQNYYQGGAPPDNRRQHNWMSGPDQGTIPSTSGSQGRGQSRAPVQVPVQAGYSGRNYDPQAAYSSSRNVERSNSINTWMANLSLNDPQLQIPKPNWMSGPDQGTIPSTSTGGSHGSGQFRASVQVPLQAGYSGGNYDSQAAYSLSRNVERSNSMNTWMANLSPNDPQLQIPTHISPPTPFSSDPQTGLKLTVQTRSSNPSTSNLNPPGPDEVDEESSLDEADGQIPTAAESTADSSGKGKKAKKWFKRK